MSIRRDDRGFSPLVRRTAPLGTTAFGVVRDTLRHEVGPQYEPDLYVDDDERITVRFIPIGVPYSVEHVEAAVERARVVLPDTYSISVFHPGSQDELEKK